MANTIKVKLVKGLIGTKQSHRATVLVSVCADSIRSESLKTRRRCAA